MNRIRLKCYANSISTCVTGIWVYFFLLQLRLLFIIISVFLSLEPNIIFVLKNIDNQSDTMILWMNLVQFFEKVHNDIII